MEMELTDYFLGWLQKMLEEKAYTVIRKWAIIGRSDFFKTPVMSIIIKKQHRK